MERKNSRKNLIKKLNELEILISRSSLTLNGIHNGFTGGQKPK